MARKLKTFQTSLGFFDLAIAAPSMKAALEAWGADSNLFHQGAASESKDPEVIEATMAKPGVVLRRPVGSDAAFSEHAGLPKHLSDERPTRATAAPKLKARPPKRLDDKASRKAAVAFEKKRRRQESERRKVEAIAEKQRARREQAVAKAQANLEEGEKEHAKRAARIEAERAP